ncbi:MAG: hydrogenase/urease maturation nickel metallochaperone HypA [Candidatus Omnitrophica bacterium]|nr:hydrogenase/urease maturation nickel metallochaperone HypA [Candidatus Omnitrophota bacterium]
MHETKFVSQIFAVLTQKLDKSSILKKITVTVRLSPFSHVSAKTLKETFKQLAEGKNFKNIELKVLPLQLLLDCKNCKRTVFIMEKKFICPFCNSSNIEIKMDKEFFIETIEVEDNK